VQSLTPVAQELLAGPNFAVVATRGADGAIQQTVVWARERDGEIVFSSLNTRVKLRNLQRDPSVGVLVIDRNNGLRYSAIRGTARLETAGAAELIDELSQVYDGQPWPEQQPWLPRTTVVVSPTRVIDHG
jgi:PPOX class probable F420-dependent enzyme